MPFEVTPAQLKPVSLNPLLNLQAHAGADNPCFLSRIFKDATRLSCDRSIAHHNLQAKNRHTLIEGL